MVGVGCIGRRQPMGIDQITHRLEQIECRQSRLRGALQNGQRAAVLDVSVSLGRGEDVGIVLGHDEDGRAQRRDTAHQWTDEPLALSTRQCALGVADPLRLVGKQAAPQDVEQDRPTEQAPECRELAPRNA